MATDADPSPSSDLTRAAWLIIPLAGLAAYANSFSGPFLFDDISGIRRNTAIRTLWPPWSWLTSGTRPVANFTFALNHAAGGYDPRGYHVLNLIIHLCAGLLLFAVARRTLLHRPLGHTSPNRAEGLALTIALLWLLHPLQTQSVTYIVQRMESLMGMLVLLTMYCFIRGAEHGASRWWFPACFASCALAMGTKEVAAGTPLLILWYDRVFVSRSWRALFRTHWKLYLALGLLWAIPAILLIRHGEALGKSGVLFVKGISPLEYLQTQPQVLLHYLRLSVWPVGQNIDWMWPIATDPLEIYLPGLIILGLIALTIVAIFRWPAWSFPGGWFFIILAPTSSVFPLRDPAFEHRMYLPLAAVMALLVLLIDRGLRALVQRGQLSDDRRSRLSMGAVICCCTILTVLTLVRNHVYSDSRLLWQDVVEKSPHNYRAQNNFALALHEEQRYEEAEATLRKAVALRGNYMESRINLGRTLIEMNRLDEALTQFRYVETHNSSAAMLHLNMGLAWRGKGEMDKARASFRKSVAIDHHSAAAHNNYGSSIVESDPETAIFHLRKALEIQPNYVDAHSNLANALFRTGKTDEALRHYNRALYLNPDHGPARQNRDRIQQHLRQKQKAGTVTD